MDAFNVIYRCLREIILQQFDELKTEIRGSPMKHSAFEGSRGYPSKVEKSPIMAHKVEKNA